MIGFCRADGNPSGDGQKDRTMSAKASRTRRGFLVVAMEKPLGLYDPAQGTPATGAAQLDASAAAG